MSRSGASADMTEPIDDALTRQNMICGDKIFPQRRIDRIHTNVDQADSALAAALFASARCLTPS
jgi:hypothetical protein